MSALFGGRSRDIAEIVTQLQNENICNESVAGSQMYETEVNNMAEGIKNLMLEHYSDIMGDEALQSILKDNSYRGRS